MSDVLPNDVVSLLERLQSVMQLEILIALHDSHEPVTPELLTRRIGSSVDQVTQCLEGCAGAGDGRAGRTAGRLLLLPAERPRRHDRPSGQPLHLPKGAGRHPAPPVSESRAPSSDEGAGGSGCRGLRVLFGSVARTRSESPPARKGPQRGRHTPGTPPGRDHTPPWRWWCCRCPNTILPTHWERTPMWSPARPRRSGPGCARCSSGRRRDGQWPPSHRRSPTARRWQGARGVRARFANRSPLVPPCIPERPRARARREP